MGALAVVWASATPIAPVTSNTRNATLVANSLRPIGLWKTLPWPFIVSASPVRGRSFSFGSGYSEAIRRPQGGVVGEWARVAFREELLKAAGGAASVLFPLPVAAGSPSGACRTAFRQWAVARGAVPESSKSGV